MNIASVVPLPGLKPNCMSSIDTFLLSLSSSTLSKNFHDIVQQLNTSVRTTFKCITFSFVHTRHPTLPPVRWNLPFPYNCVAYIRDPKYTVFTCRLQHLYSYSRWTNSFPTLHFRNSCPHLTGGNIFRWPSNCLTRVKTSPIPFELLIQQLVEVFPPDIQQFLLFYNNISITILDTSATIDIPIPLHHPFDNFKHTSLSILFFKHVTKLFPLCFL